MAEDHPSINPNAPRVRVTPGHEPGAMSTSDINKQFFGPKAKTATPTVTEQKPNLFPEGVPVYTTDDINAAFKNFEKTKTEEVAKPQMDPFQKQLYERENERLAGTQFTQLYSNKRKADLIGEAEHDGEDKVYFKNPKTGEHEYTDRNKHDVFFDPDDGKLKVYNRNKDESLGPIRGRMVGLGRFVNEGMATNGISAGPVTEAARGGLNVLGARFGGEAAQQAKGATAPWGGMQQASTEGADIADTAARLNKNTGVQVDVPRAVATDSPAINRAGQTLAAIPIGGAPLRAGAAQMGEGIAQAADAVAALPTGAHVNPAAAGDAIATGIGSHIDKKGGVLSQKIETAYDAVRSKFTKPNTKYQLQETQKAADAILKNYAKSGYDPKDAMAVQELMGPLNKPGGLTYDSVRFVRTKIGEMLRNPPEGISEGELKQLYGALKRDTRNLVSIAGGPAAVKALDRADQITAAAEARREVLSKLLGTKSDEALFHKLHSLATDRTTANIKLLTQAKKALSPEQWSEVAGGVINRLGKVNRMDGEGFDPGAFVKGYNNLSPRGKDLLFGTAGAIRESLDDIARISAKWPEAKDMANAGGLGIGVDVMSLAGAASFLTHALHTADWKPVMAAVASLFGTNVLSRAMARPVTARSAANWARRYEALRLNPGSGTLAAFNNASETLQKHLED